MLDHRPSSFKKQLKPINILIVLLDDMLFNRNLVRKQC